MIPTKSVTGKLLISLFLVLLCFQMLGAVIVLLYFRSSELDSLERRMKSVAAATAGASSGALLLYDFAPVDAVIAEVIRDADVNSVRLADGNGNVIREVTKSGDSGETRADPLSDDKPISVVSPVMSGKAKIGEVVVNYSSKDVQKRISNSFYAVMVFQVFVLLSVCSLVFFLLQKSVRKPVLRINEAIEKITKGELSTEVPDFGYSELGSIARGVVFLRMRLSDTVSKLNAITSNVSMAIKQVDVTYKNVINGTTQQIQAVKEIIASLEKAGRAHSEISDGAERLTGLSTDNVSSLIELKASAEEIDSQTQRLFKATENSYSVTTEMTYNAKAISRNSAEALTSIENTSASVEEIGVSVSEVEEHAKESSIMAEKVKENTSDIGMLAVVNALEGMDRISGEVKKSSEIIQRLGARSADIEKVLSVIKDVTEQTNLLSLNAAILAAQAGEYGKSFSVVADEISALSERTASSTREIGGIVKTIQKDIKDAVRSIDSAKVKVEEGNALVVNAGGALKEILNAAEHSTNMTKAIERATEEQAFGLRQIRDAFEDVRKMMNNIAKATREQDNALSYLLESVGDVKEVADLSKKGTEEQAAGLKMISRNFETANERIAAINQTVLTQKKLYEETVGAMERINSIGMSTVRDMEEVSLFLNTLFDEVEVLKKEVEVFKTV